jgi:dienelactone hydrolase
MKRAAWVILALALALAATWPAAAQDYIREDLRIPMAAAGPRGLEAMLVRPAAAGPFPLALISHGSPPDPQERPKMSPYGMYRQAIEFTRRGFAALVVMRRGYGDSGGSYAESTCCNASLYSSSFQATSADLRAAIAAMNGRNDVTTQGMIAVGASAGGLASVALASRSAARACRGDQFRGRPPLAKARRREHPACRKRKRAGCRLQDARRARTNADAVDLCRQ